MDVRIHCQEGHTTVLSDGFLARWFGGKCGHWYSPKTKETHYQIINPDIGLYHFAIPDEKLGLCIAEGFLFIKQISEDYLYNMKMQQIAYRVTNNTNIPTDESEE